MLLIYAGSTKNVISQGLSLRPLVFIGLLSYSWYLWHWVVFTFARYSIGPLEGELRWYSIALSFVLAYLSWRFVEQPFRHRFKWEFKKTLIVLFVLPVLVFAALAAFVDENDGLYSRFASKGEAVVALQTAPSSFMSACDEKDAKTCKDIVLIGDSHAEHFGDFVNVLAADAGLSFQTRLMPGCRPLYDVYPVIRGGSGYKYLQMCRDYMNELLDGLGSPRFVVLAGFWASTIVSPESNFIVSSKQDELSQEHSNKLSEQALEMTFAKIAAAKARPVVLIDNLALDKETFKCLARKQLGNKQVECVYPASELAKQQAFIVPLMKRLAERYPETVFIDPNALLCDEQACLTEFAGLPIYKDEDHLNGIASRTLAEHYLLRYKNPFTDE